MTRGIASGTTIVSASAIAFAIAVSGAFLARGEPAPARCATSRPLNDSETRFLSDATGSLRALVPDAPAGWKRHRIADSATSGPLCEDDGYKPPLFARVSAAYEPARPDPKRPRRADVRLQVNASAFPTCGKSDPLPVDGAAAAFRASGTTCRDKTAGEVLLFAFGAWQEKPTSSGLRLAAFNEWPAPPVPRATAHTVLAEIYGDEEAVDALARWLDPARLAALIGR